MKADLWLSSIRIVGIALSFLIQIVLVKVIGAAEYGLYILFLSWSTIFSQILILGYDRILIKDLSYLFIHRERRKFRAILDKTTGLILINCCSFILLAYIIPFDAIKGIIFSENLMRSSWLLIALGSVLFTGFQFLGKILISTQQIGLSYLRSEIVYKVIFLVTVFLLFYYLQGVLGLNVILVSVLISYTITIILFIFYDWARIKDYLKIDRVKVKLGNQNYVFFFLTFNYFLINQLDKIQLGRVETMQLLGSYGLASTLCGMTGFSVVGYSRLIPKMSSYINDCKLNQLDYEFRICVKNAILIALPVVGFLFVFADDVLLFFGQEYIIMATALRILLVGQMIYYFTGPNGNLLYNGGFATKDMIMSFVAVALTLIMNLVGFHLIGYIGVAIATSLGVIIMNLSRVVLVKYYIGIFPYSIDVFILSFITFSAFGFTKYLQIDFNHLLISIVINFLLGTLIALIVNILIFRILGKKILNNKEGFFAKI